MSKNHQKKIIVIIIVVGVLICLSLVFSSTYVSPQEVIKSIGNYEQVDYYSNDGFQDYTDFAIYTYEEPNVENSDYFIRFADTNELNTYLDNFENWVDLSKGTEIYENYNFDRSILDDEDYYYISDKYMTDDFYSKFDNYDFYIYDYQTKTLHYFHNNI